MGGEPPRAIKHPVVKGWPWPVFRLKKTKLKKKTKFRFVFRSAQKKARISLLISFDYKKFRKFRWFSNGIRVISKNIQLPPTVKKSFMNPEQGFQSGPGDSTNAD